MPLSQIPFGLLDYNIHFFAKGTTQMLGIEEHYVLWLATMFSHFGHKWLCLHRGPAWQYEIEPEVLGEEVSVEEETVEEESVEAEEESVEVEFLEEESFEMESVEEIDIIQSALQESSVCLTVDIKEIAHASHLWTNARTSQQMDIEVGLLSFQHMERIHGVQPTGNCTTRNPGMYNPLKVGIKLVVEGQCKRVKGQHTFLIPGVWLMCPLYPR